MKNVILATLFAFGLSALAQEPTAPAATGSEQPAAATAPAPEHGAEHAKKDMKHDKKAKAAPKKKKEEGGK